MSTEAKKLFGLMASFATETIVGMLYLIFNQYGHKTLFNFNDGSLPVVNKIIVPFLNAYLNMTFRNVKDRSDDFINKRFDKMRVVAFGRLYYHSEDLIKMVANLIVAIIGAINLRIIEPNEELKIENAAEMFKKIKDLVSSCANSFEYFAKDFVGCEINHSKECNDSFIKIEFMKN